MNVMLAWFYSFLVGIAAIQKDIDKRFLQLYLNEYCWKFNRRFFRDSTDPEYGLFDRLVKISAAYISGLFSRRANSGLTEARELITTWKRLKAGWDNGYLSKLLKI